MQGSKTVKIRRRFYMALLLFCSLSGRAQVDYRSEVAPIFEEHCGRHLGAAESGVNLTSNSALMESFGEQYRKGPVVAFEPAQSPLFDVVSNETPLYGRPMPPFGAPLSAERIRLLESWIRQGARGPSQEAPLRGDINGSGQVDISDAIGLLVYLFNEGKEPLCRPVADCNFDGDVDITDAVTVLVFLFQGGLELESLSEKELEECSPEA